MNEFFVNHGHDSAWGLRVIERAEKHYKASFVCYSSLLDNGGSWTNNSYAVFYQPVKHKPEYSHYFGLSIKNGQVFITSAESIADVVILAVFDPQNGELLYSRSRRDFRTATLNQALSIDGGRDYSRATGPILENLMIVDGALQPIDDNLFVIPNHPLTTFNQLFNIELLAKNMFIPFPGENIRQWVQRVHSTNPIQGNDHILVFQILEGEKSGWFTSHTMGIDLKLLRQWLVNNLDRDSYLWVNGRLYFSSHDQAILFKLTWPDREIVDETYHNG